MPFAHINTWIANFITHTQPRIPLEGVRIAKHRMHFDCSKARQELGLPQTSPETAFKKAVEWFRQHGYA